MSDAEFETRLTEALYRAAEIDYMVDMPTDNELRQIVQPSPRFKRRMKALLRNPRSYAKRYRRPVSLRVLRSVAAIFIACMLLLGTAMAVSPTVRAAVVNFVRSWFEDRTEYKTQNSPTENNWTFSYIPAGFNLTMDMTNKTHIFRMYENEASEQIFIEINTGAIAVDNENSIFYQITINGRTADVYETFSNEHYHIIVIYDEPSGVFITLSSSLSIEELIRIAENISR